MNNVDHWNVRQLPLKYFLNQAFIYGQWDLPVCISVVSDHHLHKKANHNESNGMSKKS